MTRVLLAGGGTGGHLMPALAIANATTALHPDWEMVFAGALRGIEAEVLPARGVRHHLLPLEPIYRQQWWKNVRWPFRAIRLIRQIDAMLDREHPDVVVGTGGYVSGPVVWRAARRGIPTGILDLDVQPGIATRWLAGSVQQIWLATPEALRSLPLKVRHKATVVGAPITPPVPASRSIALEHFGLDATRPVIVVTGGSQGSRAVNRIVAAWMEQGGLGNAQLIWATGRNSFHEFAALHKPPAVCVMPFIDPMSEAWAVADLAITRAGMMTIAELCAWGIPGILIPLPTAAADHQTLNAKALANAGAAVMLRQEGLSAADLGQAVNQIIKDPHFRERLATAALGRGRPAAAQELALRVASLATSQPRLS